MSADNLKSGYRWQMTAALGRGFFTGASQIYTTSVFIAHVGADQYPQLVFYSFLASALVMALFPFLSLRGMCRVYATSFAFMLVVTLANAALPLNHLLIYMFAICSQVDDSIALNVVTAMIQERFSPAVAPGVHQRALSTELMGRVAACIVMMVLSHPGFSFAPFFGLAVVSILMQLLATVVVGRSLKGGAQGVGPDSEASAEAQETPWVRVRQATRFIFSNSLVLTALVVSVWARVAKFSVDTTFFRSVHERTTSVSEVSSFLSSTTTLTIALSWLLQQFLTPRLQSRHSLSTLFSVVPLANLAFCALAIVTHSFWLALALYVSYLTLSRVVLFPAVRQCLLPVPRRYGHMVFFMVMFLSFISNVAISGVMNNFRDSWQTPHFLYLLVAISVGLLFFTVRLDTGYIQNLWQVYAERVGGGADGRVALRSWGNGVSMADMPSPAESGEGFGAAGELAATDGAQKGDAPLGAQRGDASLGAQKVAAPLGAQKGNAQNGSAPLGAQNGSAKLPLRSVQSRSAAVAEIRAGYRMSQTHAQLAALNVAHRALLRSEDWVDRWAALELMSEIGLPEFAPYYQSMMGDAHPQVASFAAQMHHASRAVVELQGPALSARAREALFHLARASVATQSWPLLRPKLVVLLRSLDAVSCERWFELLWRHAGTPEADVLLNCLHENSHRRWKAIDFMPLVELCFARPFAQTLSLRQAFVELAPRWRHRGFVRFVQQKVLELEAKQFSFWRAGSDERDGAMRDEFLHALYFSEWIAKEKGSRSPLLGSIADLINLSGAERELLVTLHLEYLKGTPLYSSWLALFRAPRA